MMGGGCIDPTFKSRTRCDQKSWGVIFSPGHPVQNRVKAEIWRKKLQESSRMKWNKMDKNGLFLNHWAKSGDFWTHYRGGGYLSLGIKISPSDPKFSLKIQNGQNS